MSLKYEHAFTPGVQTCAKTDEDTEKFLVACRMWAAPTPTPYTLYLTRRNLHPTPCVLATSTASADDRVHFGGDSARRYAHRSCKRESMKVGVEGVWFKV